MIEKRMAIKISYFKTPGQLIYGHCEVHICDPNAETCAPSCDGSRKRWVINIYIENLCCIVKVMHEKLWSCY